MLTKWLLATFLAAFFVSPVHAAIGSGSRTNTASILGQSFTIYTYKPPVAQCPSADLDLMFVFHGSSRNARGYRDSARDFADDHCLLVVAPLFTESRFPSSAYQRANIVTSNGTIRPKSQWTTRFVAPMIAWAKGQQTDQDMDVYLYGFSAGGQFLSRVAAYDPIPSVISYIVASPSTHVRASISEAAPYGFQGFSNSAAMRDAYLAAPVSIIVGEDDNDPNDADLGDSQAAQEQGPHRRARAEFVYNEARAVGANPFNWLFAIAPNVAHSNGDMMRSPALSAMFRFPCTCP